MWRAKSGSWVSRQIEHPAPPSAIECKTMPASDVQSDSQLVSIVFDACQYLYLPNTTACQAIHYLRNFLSFLKRNTLDRTDSVSILSGCIFLSCKATENHRSVRDIVNVLMVVEDPDVSLAQMEKLYQCVKPRVVETEHQLLRILEFNVEKDLPHKYLLNLARYLKMSRDSVYIAWTLLNEAYGSREIETSRPEDMAAACLWIGDTWSRARADEQAQTTARGLHAQHDATVEEPAQSKDLLRRLLAAGVIAERLQSTSEWILAHIEQLPVRSSESTVVEVES